jgi:GNAT superfamily N-acetyltransferase
MSDYLNRAHGPYTLSDDPTRLDLEAMHAYLRQAYWSEGIPLEVLTRAVRDSLCVGAYDACQAQIGLTRCISDYATFCYLCDVYVLEAHRRRGLARAMMEVVVGHPRLQGLRRWMLVTRDAHPLYREFGFTPLGQPERHMERRVLDVYRQAEGPG